MVGFEAVAEVEIVANGEIVLLSGSSVLKNSDLIGDADEFALVGGGRSEGSKCGEKDLSQLDFFIINYNLFLIKVKIRQA